MKSITPHPNVICCFYLLVDDELLSEKEIASRFVELQEMATNNKLDFAELDLGAVSIKVDDTEILGQDYISELRFIIPIALTHVWGQRLVSEFVLSKCNVIPTLSLDDEGFKYELRDAITQESIVKKKIPYVLEFFQALTECELRMLRTQQALGNQDFDEAIATWNSPRVWYLDYSRLYRQMAMPIVQLLEESKC